MALVDPIRAEFQREMETCRRLLERIPEDRFGWKPHPRSYSMGDLSCHLINVIGWVEPLMTLEQWSIGPGARGWSAGTWLELMERFDRNSARALQLLQGPSDEELTAEWSLKRGGEVVFRARRIEALRFAVLNHAVHHRGQLSVYLRLNDIPVPPIYGPTADESG